MDSFKTSRRYIVAYNKNISKHIRTVILLSKLSERWFDYKSRIETLCPIARQHNLGLTIFATMTFMVIRAIKLLLYKMRRQVYHKRYFIEKMLIWKWIFYIHGSFIFIANTLILHKIPNSLFCETDPTISLF